MEVSTIPQFAGVFMGKRWVRPSAKATFDGDFPPDWDFPSSRSESQVEARIPNMNAQASNVDAQVLVVQRTFETSKDEDVVVEVPKCPVTQADPPVTQGDKKISILRVPVIAVPLLQLPTWWIWAPESFIQENSDRLLQFGPKDPLVPLVNGVPHFVHRWVRVKEKPRYLLWKNQCAICERIFCGHGMLCTRKNFSCKWCHFPHTEECFFSSKDKHKFILKTRGEGFCGKLTDLRGR